MKVLHNNQWKDVIAVYVKDSDDDFKKVELIIQDSTILFEEKYYIKIRNASGNVENEAILDNNLSDILYIKLYKGDTLITTDDWSYNDNEFKFKRFNSNHEMELEFDSENNGYLSDIDNVDIDITTKDGIKLATWTIYFE